MVKMKPYSLGEGIQANFLVLPAVPGPSTVLLWSGKATQTMRGFFFGFWQSFVMFIDLKIDELKNHYFTKSEASCALCNTCKRTICLFQHHLPRPCKARSSEKLLLYNYVEVLKNQS